MNQKSPRVLLAAPSSGSGKTMITCGLLQAMKHRGFHLASFKCGPDYIDPMFHEKVIGTQSGNLDTFFAKPKEVKEQFVRESKDKNFSIIEGVMGYFDGLGGVSTKASSYDVAKAIDCPVILIVNGKGMSLSLIPVIKGFLDYETGSYIKGVIVNRITAGIFSILKPIMEAELGIQVLGYVPESEEFKIESRHLGLRRPSEIEDIKERLLKLASVLEQTVDIEGLIAIGFNASILCPSPNEENNSLKKWKSSISVAVAYDEAFCFYYKQNLHILQEMGAELVYFSPLHEQNLPCGVNGILLGGGYPELYGAELSQNKDMIHEMRTAIANKMPVIGECGGFMYLHQWLEDKDGTFYPMVGAINGKAIRTDSLKRFGYITLTANHTNFLFQEGEQIRGHEFHYWDSTENGDSFRANKPVGKRNWNCIHCTDSLMAGYPHLYYASNPKLVSRFLAACQAYKRGAL